MFLENKKAIRGDLKDTTKIKRSLKQIIVEVSAVLLCSVVFLIPFYFIFVNGIKTGPEAAQLSIAWPSEIRMLENFVEVLQARDGMLLVAFFNSTIITVLSVIILMIVCSMASFILQRRKGKVSTFMGAIFLSGLMIPPAVVPTIWVLDQLHLFKTFPGIILVMIAINIPFSIILYTGFITTIPK